ncbi:ATP-binding protein [Vibrio vulnificus]|uniref:ATP-binding protein n=1 Tax=Vibrio vulnificus TaxID=672 RepID=UPI0024DFA141|nr:ATP-binding protein [Vibrio vulnificus]MDK2621427.1 ATP-binding protein [Vibrio vulnificus]
MTTFEKEALHDALAELKKSRELEKRLAEENKAILSAISAMSEAKNRHEIFLGLNNVLKKYINFDDFVVLTRHCDKESFATLLTTNQVFNNTTWCDGKKFSRVLNGECIILFEPTELSEFKQLNSFIKSHINSVLLTGIDAQVTQSVILLIGNTKGQFSIEAKETLKCFLPLIERAVIDIENKEKLQRIVELRTRELALAREESERANRAKSEFLAMMSHELRTPLNSVLGMLDVLKQSDMSAGHINLLSHMESSAGLLLAIISDILDLSKIESGEFSLSPQWININDTVTFVVSQQQLVAATKGLNIELSIELDDKRHYWLDPSRLSQVLFNLIGNAVKFTQQGQIDIRVNLENDELSISVIDTGIGIEKDKISSLFTAFKQADSSITRKFGGTGLGLAITKHLVELMSGTVRVSSQFGKGSTFVVKIPVKSRKLIRLSQDGTTNKRDRALNVLVVEDTHSNQMVIQLLLNKLGHNVFIANNGSEAIEFIESNTESLDVVFMDVSMPVMDGLTATKILRAKGFEVPIIALTAHALASDKQNCLDVGMDSFVAKPVRKQELANAIEALIV